MPKKCCFVAFPQHPHASRGQSCDKNLLAEVCIRDGNKRYYPQKVYFYKSLIDRLSELVKRKEFLNDCELWRERNLPAGILGDVYDERV